MMVKRGIINELTVPAHQSSPALIKHPGKSHVTAEATTRAAGRSLCEIWREVLQSLVHRYGAKNVARGRPPSRATSRSRITLNRATAPHVEIAWFASDLNHRFLFVFDGCAGPGAGAGAGTGCFAATCFGDTLCHPSSHTDVARTAKRCSNHSFIFPSAAIGHHF